jgi:hypothetical protein
MGEAGRLRVLDHFAIQTMVNRVAEVYEGAVAGDRVTP